MTARELVTEMMSLMHVYLYNCTYIHKCMLSLTSVYYLNGKYFIITVGLLDGDVKFHLEIVCRHCQCVTRHS